MDGDLSIDPPGPTWADLIRRRDAQDDVEWLGRSMRQWRALTRRELGLPDDRAIIAAGHQPIAWHPGIFAKFVAVDAVARRLDAATVNLIVDQDDEPPASVDAPARGEDGALRIATIQMTPERPGVPVGLLPAFEPMPVPANVPYALPCVNDGLGRLHEALVTHRQATNAGMQMALAMRQLMGRAVGPTAHVMASQLMGTSLARSLIELMASDPERCAASYNRAAAGVPEAGIRPLRVEAGRIELPLWRIGDDLRRMPAGERDLAAAPTGPDGARPRLWPRALFMTALARLAMTDLFVHGTGGATYDRAMEYWISEWLSVKPGPKQPIHPAPMAMVTATLRLPFPESGRPRLHVQETVAAARRAWHDPESVRASRHPGIQKSRWLQAIRAAPRHSAQRREAYQQMHDWLASHRASDQGAVAAARAAADEARRLARNWSIIDRRTWAFPLYPTHMIDELAAEIGRRFP